MLFLSPNGSSIFYIHLNKLACHLVLPVIYITVIIKIILHMAIILELHVKICLVEYFREVLMYCFYGSCLQSANNLMFKVTIVRGTTPMLMHVRKIFS